MLEKNYNPKDFEEKIYSDWERDNDFKPDMRSDKDAFCVVIPPPNVTGVLHNASTAKYNRTITYGTCS